MNIFIGSSKEIAEHKEGKKGFLLKVARIVEKCGHNPLSWDDDGLFIAGNFTLESLIDNIDNESIEAAIFICSEHDKTWYSCANTNKPVPRGNVLFECGLYMGHLGRKNAVIIRHGEVELPSDLNGLNYVRFKNDNHKKGEEDLIDWLQRLEDRNAAVIKPTAVPTIATDDVDTDSGEETPASGQLDLPSQPISKIVEMVPLEPGTVKTSDGRQIQLSHPLDIAKYPITKGIYDKVTRDVKVSNEAISSLPVVNVSFFDAVNFCNKLSELEGHSHVYTVANDKVIWNKNTTGYRLPCEIEWDYALRHGYRGQDIPNELDDLAWYSKNADRMTHAVGEKQGTQSGIYDLLGNVREWCFDSFQDPPNYNCDTQNENSGFRVVKGGSFSDFGTVFKGLIRNKLTENLSDKYTGFRIVFEKTEGS